MQTVALLALLVLVSVALRVAERVRPARPEGADPDPSPAARAWTAARERAARRHALPLLPEGHRPPAGLGPLSPSERFLRSESARGIRALQAWLLDQDGTPA